MGVRFWIYNGFQGYNWILTGESHRFGNGIYMLYILILATFLQKNTIKEM